jgi:hypothetical protein
MLNIFKKTSEYSLKRILAVLFTMLAIYLGIRDGNEAFQYYVATLSFVGALLGLQSWDKITFSKQNPKT